MYSYAISELNNSEEATVHNTVNSGIDPSMHSD